MEAARMLILVTIPMLKYLPSCLEEPAAGIAYS
jgi:hypothetical protein